MNIHQGWIAIHSLLDLLLGLGPFLLIHQNLGVERQRQGIGVIQMQGKDGLDRI